MDHPNAQQLEAFVEGSLDSRERTRVRRHLLVCRSCENDVEEWRSLFTALSTLPRFAPAPGFADRIMTKVHMRRPWHAGAWSFLQHAMPHTTWGWAATAAVFALPVIAGISLLTWLLSKSYVTAHGLWVFATGQFVATGASLIGAAADIVMRTDAAAWLARGVATATQTSARGIGVLAATLALLSIVSAWVLYRNLFRSRSRESDYVRFRL
jgi:hypothetical protein